GATRLFRYARRQFTPLLRLEESGLIEGPPLSWCGRVPVREQDLGRRRQQSMVASGICHSRYHDALQLESVSEWRRYFGRYGGCNRLRCSEHQRTYWGPRRINL